MASETRCTITVDESHDPPRWLRAEGLQFFEKATKLGFIVGIACALGFIGLTIAAVKSSQVRFPLWIAGVTLGGYLFVSFSVHLWILRSLKRTDHCALDAISDKALAVHRDAIIASVCSLSSVRWLHSGTFIEHYRSQGLTPPCMFIAGVFEPKRIPVEHHAPQHFTSDPPLSRRNSLLLFVVMAAPSLYIIWTLASLLHRMGMTSSIWNTLLPFFVIVLVSPVINYIQHCLFTPRRTAIIENGAVEFRRLMRRRKLTTNDAFCFIHAQKHLTRIEWYENGKPRAAHTLRFLKSDDPRIQTILNLWTADPLPDSAP